MSCIRLPTNSDLILKEKSMLKFQERSQTTTLEEANNFCNEEEERKQEKQTSMQKEGRTQHDESSVSCLKIITNMPSFQEGDEEDDQCTTPTSKDNKIQLIFPPTPKKAKTLPSAKRKRCNSKRMLLLDCSKQIEAVFPLPDFLADLGGKIKKVRANLA
ncbi:hypothetical protein LIER_06097 [Lithospermum erythrorhizon]|uniref:Cyclin-dependent protein kinase inhibitor SMR3 n=1 Tax=Lithospermum erythrorhizon TaxID=34254 RepID=A0AAV3P391_LITER